MVTYCRDGDQASTMAWLKINKMSRGRKSNHLWVRIVVDDYSLHVFYAGVELQRALEQAAALAHLRSV